MSKCWCGICDLVLDCIAGGLPERCYVNKLIDANEKLVKMLKQCDPFEMNAEEECHECGMANGEVYCIFCGSNEDHMEDCEYRKAVEE